MPTISIIVGVALLLVTLGLRGASANRFVRPRGRRSCQKEAAENATTNRMVV